ncbi:DUF2017 family protein [Nesterenkonia lutea]|uniref:DUF2017 domain-containing protein n=1 Tax=Nesterenkonia lutea TaxID=272919 RepID=A0ABR9JCK7_9MICC|nr:DUF2017 family protein [Nesterenkonia lutea]MBE1523659.1 hypothetical protein [Nesterenkonia lutea]
MATAFRATTRGYRADLEQHERRLLSSLCADVIALLQTRQEESAADAAPIDDDPALTHFRAELAGLGGDEPLAAPEDAVLRRLLPDAFADEEEAGHFRRLSENSLRGAKIADLRTARMLLESSPINMEEELAPVFGRALNDLRLTLASRLDLETEEDAQRVHELAVASGTKDSESFMAEIYTFITWLQESLFSAMMEFLPEEGEGDRDGASPGSA